MGFFSSKVPTPLHPGIQSAVSFAFREDLVGRRLIRIAMAKIAKEQGGLLRSLAPNELLALIVPCSSHDMYEGLLVLTNQRLLEFKSGTIRAQMPLEHVARTTLGAHPGGFIIIQIIGKNYVPFSAGMNEHALAEFWRNHIQVNVQTAEAAHYAIEIIDGACGIRR